MILKLLVKVGPRAGEQFDLKAGAIVGRSGTEISLNDSKVSGKHAKIEKDPGGHWVIVDMGSTNGIRVQGKRLAQVTLSAGLTFKVGNTEIEVISAHDPTLVAEAPPPVPVKIEPPEPPKLRTAVPLAQQKANEKPAPPSEPQDEVSVSGTSAGVEKPELDGPAIKPPPDWSQYLSAFAGRAKDKVESRPNPLKPFDPLLVLTVVQGPQLGTEWVLGYGPRVVGLDSIDLHLFDSHAPGIAFTVTPKGPFAFFETDAPKKVRLNNRPLSSETLRSEDKITVGDTVIRVSYKE